MSGSLAPLRRFVAAFSALLDTNPDETVTLARGGALLRDLLAADDWLPETHAVPDAERYRQYLLHRDPGGRFSVVSFVWGPGQSTPVHDHRVWGLVGVLRGAEIAESYVRDAAGLRRTEVTRLERGAIDAVSPTLGDLHKVSNGLADAPSVSIHVYGADIGAVRRFTYDASGDAKPFVSGYSPAPALSL
ncbi:cysteine dioxygenase [Sphingomonas sp. BK235]|uniref:cysteine dioxygenase family protein n=1 Tax=Sphingomonas sp. BK235 TaxID=2512131 RepID=UPI0010539ACC|nr:cysteine dioxygenase [Sphingomonas sp. BK235]TCP33225.1 putative metal-dependent enzyme (double-stranded beta helix superfamily) [Sphingomonas sp. BK235]